MPWTSCKDLSTGGASALASRVATRTGRSAIRSGAVDRVLRREPSGQLRSPGRPPCGGHHARDLPPRRAPVEVRRGPPALLAEGPAGEPASQRGRPGGDRRGHREPRQVGGRRPVLEPGGLHARARADAGLHRRAGDRGPGRHARRHGRPRGRPRPHQPAGAGGARDRPLDPGGRVRRAPGLPAQRRARVRAQPRALRLPALGTDRLRGLRRGAAEHRHLPPGEPGVPRARGGDPRRAGLPRHAGGHRLPHHDGERPRACSAGAWAGSRPRRPCWASPCRC